MKIVKVNDPQELKEAGIPFSKTTLYVYHSQGKYPEIFLKIGNILCIDLDAWQTVLETAKAKAAARAQKINKLKQGLNEA